MEAKTVSKFPTLIVLVGVVSVGFRLLSGDNSQVADVAAGQRLYEKYCATCHGADGKGEGPAAIYLSPKPRDFSRGVFKFQSTPYGSLPTDEDLLHPLGKGMPGSAMPSWDMLSLEQRKDLVAYIKTFSDRFNTEKPAGILMIGGVPTETPEKIRDGKAVYALMGCGACHGKTGAGDGPSADGLMDDLGRPLRPYNFTRAGAFKGGGTPSDIYRTFSTGIGGTPMPGYDEDALMITRESFTDFTFLEDQYSPEEVKAVEEYVLAQPTEGQMAQMTKEQRTALADARRWSLVYYVLSLSESGKTPVSYTTKDHSLTAVSVKEVSPFFNPAAEDWKKMNAEELALISLWQRDTPTDRVLVKSVTDGKAIAIHLEWEDPTKDDNALYNAEFGDAAAVQFPLDPRSEPFFAMGDTNLVVNIWHWKSLWEKDLQQFAGVNEAFPQNATDFYLFDVSGDSRAEYFFSKDSARALSMEWNAGWGSGNLLSAQVRKSSVEDLNAKGFGTLVSQSTEGQNVVGKGAWQDGKWSVVFVRTLVSPDKNDVVLKPGSTIPVAFAIWDGSLGDRNGQKMVTNWYQLTIRTK